MQTALLLLTFSTVALIVIAAVFRIEDAHSGNRVVFVTLRELFDRMISFLGSKLSKADTYFGRGFARLLLHYAAHGLLHRLLVFIEKTQRKVEQLLRRNKQVSSDIRHAKNTHLSKIADHKDEVALSDVEKQKMRLHE